MTRLIAVIAVSAWALCVTAGAGCSRSHTDPSASAASTANAEPPEKNEPAGHVSTALATSRSAPASATAANALADCNEVCEPVRKLGCRRASECVESCRQMAASEVCRTELLQFYACLSSTPAEHWECLDDGTGAIKEGFCEREQSLFAACLEKSDVR